MDLLVHVMLGKSKLVSLAWATCKASCSGGGGTRILWLDPD